MENKRLLSRMILTLPFLKNNCKYLLEKLWQPFN